MDKVAKWNNGIQLTAVTLQVDPWRGSVYPTYRKHHWGWEYRVRGNAAGERSARTRSLPRSDARTITTAVWPSAPEFINRLWQSRPAVIRYGILVCDRSDF